MTTPLRSRPPVEAAAGAYTISLADTPEQVRAAQRLRHQVFAHEQGALLDTPVPGHDIDSFDAHADHLLVTERATGEVVGTYRLFPPGRGGPSYSATEFDMDGLPGDVRGSLVETGRVCVHPDHRSGAVITLLWSGIARYVLLSGYRYLGGCASVSLDDGGEAAGAVRALTAARHAAPPELTVHPRTPWRPARPRPGTGDEDQTALPALLRAYLRLGAWVCGEPHYDPAFGTADFFVLLDTERLNPRYRRFFLGER